MTPSLVLAIAAIAMTALATPAHAQRSAYEAMIAEQAKANNVPETLVHRVVIRESKYQANLIGRGNTIGLMQIKLPTARGVGYHGDAEGLRDPETNLTYGVRYLAGAYRVAHGNHDRAVALYARGYYYDAKRMGGLPPIRTASISTAPAAVEPAAAPAQPSDQVEPRSVVSLPIKGVPIPRSRPDSTRVSLAKSDLAPDLAKPDLAKPDVAEARASVPTRSAPARRERPAKNGLAKFWDDLTGWARR